MGWTLTGVVTRAGKAVGLRRRWTSPYAVSHAAGRAQRGAGPRRDTVYARAFQLRSDRASLPDRKALESARAALGADGAVIERAAATGAPIEAIAELAARWDALPETTRALISNPLGRVTEGPVKWGAVAIKQVDGTTCGAAALGLMNAIADPFLALWLLTGKELAGYRPRELSWLRARTATRSIELRWRALQRAVHHATTRRALGIAPWPTSLGTPPWQASAVARAAQVRFLGALVDDRDARDVRVLVAHASAALRDGIPVLLYSSGDSRKGLSTVMPRHVVLLTARTEDGFMVYEPGSGAIHELKDDQLGGRSGPLAALGNWSRVSWMVLPSPRRRASLKA